jgi:sugar O-acyltransferase (sialic acid O-acetyltransferase NeuD family)
MDVVIFGLGQQASVTWYNLTHDSTHRVVAFTVDAAYRTGDRLHALPVVAFEELEAHFPPERAALLAPLGYRRMNAPRAEKFVAGKGKGYRFISYVSQRAIVWPDLQLGENCIIQAGTIVQPFVSIGDSCMLMMGASVGHHARIGDNCCLAAQAVLGGGVETGVGCVIGINSTVRNGIRVAPRCLIGAGAVVAADTEPNGVYVGVPARRQAKTVDELGE